MLQESITELKSHLEDENAPFGVDLLIPQLGGNARKTNVRSFLTYTEHGTHAQRAQYDYTHGQLPALTDVIIKNKAALFVCAVGVPPREMVEKLHAAGIVVMKYVLAYRALRSPSLTPNDRYSVWSDTRRYSLISCTCMASAHGASACAQSTRARFVMQEASFWWRTHELWLRCRHHLCPRRRRRRAHRRYTLLDPDSCLR